MTAHSLQPNEEHDAGYLTSMVTHQILPLDSQQFDDSLTDNIHKYEEDGFIQEEKDCMYPTFVTHQVPLENSLQHLLSMKAHILPNLEELTSGTHNSMMTHQLFVIQSDDQSIGVTEIDNPADKKTDVIEQEKDFMFPSSVTQQVNPENPSQNMISMSVHGLQTTMEQNAETVSPIIGDQLLLLAKQESGNTTNEIDNSEYDGNDTNMEKGEFMSPSSLTHQVSIKDPTPEINTMVAYSHPNMEHKDTGTSLSMVTHHTEIIDSQLSKDNVIGTEDEESFTVLEENECMLHSCVAHKVLTEDVSDQNVSMTAHSVQTTEELDSISLPSMVEHQTLLLNTQQSEDDLTDTYIQKNKDADVVLEQNNNIFPSTVTHEIITEDIPEHTLSMVTHSIQNTEELDVGHLHSMVTHHTLLGDCDSCSHLIIDDRLSTVNTTEEKEDEDNLTYGEMISSCAYTYLDGTLDSEVRSVPHSAHDYSQENAVPFQNLSKAAKRRRRRKLQKSFKRSQEILMDDMEDEESILEPSEKQYPKSMVTHLEAKTETENVPCSVVAHWEYSVDNEKGGIMTSAVGHQTIEWTEEMESMNNTDRETIKDALNDGPMSPTIIPTPEIQTNHSQSMNPSQSKDKLRKSQRVSRLQRLQRTKERLQEKEKSPSPSLVGSQEEEREWIEDKITDVDVDIDMNPGATSEQSTSPPSLPEVDVPDNYVEKSFENVMDASNKIYNEKVATKHKLTIERIEQLRKVVIEEIENCEIDKNENRTSSLERTVVSNVRGVIFPLEISIYNSKSEEQLSLDNKDEEDNLRKNDFDHAEEIVDYCNNKHNLVELRNTKEYREHFIEEDNSEQKLTKIKDRKLNEDISDVNDSKNKSAQLSSAEETKVIQLEDTENVDEENCNKITSEEEREIPLSAVSSSSNISVAIKAPLENKGNDSGFEGSPDIRKQQEDENVAAANELSRYHYRRQSSLTKNTEEIKIRDKELLESFLKNENHEKKEDSPVEEITLETKATNRIPQIPLPVLKKSSEQQKESGFKRKIISTDYKDKVMKQTYKIRFKVNLRQVADTEPEKPTVIKSLLNFFKKFTVFGRK